MLQETHEKILNSKWQDPATDIWKLFIPCPSLEPHGL